MKLSKARYDDIIKNAPFEATACEIYENDVLYFKHTFAWHWQDVDGSWQADYSKTPKHKFSELRKFIVD